MERAKQDFVNAGLSRFIRLAGLPRCVAPSKVVGYPTTSSLPFHSIQAFCRPYTRDANLTADKFMQASPQNVLASHAIGGERAVSRFETRLHP